MWQDNQFACGHCSLPQEPVGQRPRHSYSLRPDARPQIQMSSINLFLQLGAGSQVGLVRGLPPNPAAASLLNYLLSLAWGQIKPLYRQHGTLGCSKKRARMESTIKAKSAIFTHIGGFLVFSNFYCDTERGENVQIERAETSVWFGLAKMPAGWWDLIRS